ncbi:YhzD family protein [Virgibacillus sp. W0181]|uniref:YhzD family protein n=1 Tax=Virgibacillus sp. W0181 TaxID=3391581 RepID=UPI003F45CE81
MKDYFLTVFSTSGKKLLDESFSSKNDEDAKTIGKKRLSEEGYEEYTHRCVTPDAKLLLFHR